MILPEYDYTVFYRTGYQVIENKIAHASSQHSNWQATTF